ncbi:hypothetical protein [Clostridium puniceum]|uniref:hypothetical protein n=1 Tax=Clostridium puniceum TaxID=29367 RepID=UPI0011776E5A|nr:hypothetical protein [Clostridium puniceum]
MLWLNGELLIKIIFHKFNTLSQDSLDKQFLKNSSNATLAVRTYAPNTGGFKAPITIIATALTAHAFMKHFCMLSPEVNTYFS